MLKIGNVLGVIVLLCLVCLAGCATHTQTETTAADDEGRLERAYERMLNRPFKDALFIALMSNDVRAILPMFLEIDTITYARKSEISKTGTLRLYYTVCVRYSVQSGDSFEYFNAFYRLSPNSVLKFQKVAPMRVLLAK